MLTLAVIALSALLAAKVAAEVQENARVEDEQNWAYGPGQWHGHDQFPGIEDAGCQPCGGRKPWWPGHHGGHHQQCGGWDDSNCCSKDCRFSSETDECGCRRKCRKDGWDRCESSTCEDKCCWLRDRPLALPIKELCPDAWCRDECYRGRKHGNLLPENGLLYFSQRVTFAQAKRECHDLGLELADLADIKAARDAGFNVPCDVWISRAEGCGDELHGRCCFPVYNPCRNTVYWERRFKHHAYACANHKICHPKPRCA